jgi:2-methylcitrate dehydratase PrpD
MTDALRQIRQDVTLDLSEIEEVRIGTSRHAHDRVIGTIREPQDLTDAQFSATFSVALYLIRAALVSPITPRTPLPTRASRS